MKIQTQQGQDLAKVTWLKRGRSRAESQALGLPVQSSAHGAPTQKWPHTGLKK